MNELEHSAEAKMPRLQDLLSRIDMLLNPRVLVEANPVLTRETLTPRSVPNLSDLFVPWYKRGGIPVFQGPGTDSNLFPCVVHDLPKYGDQPLSIAEVAASAGPAHPWYKPGSIRHNPPPTGWHPAYNVGGGRRLLLDGNHRCISLARSSIDYSIDLIVINAPIREDILADLVVFEGR